MCTMFCHTSEGEHLTVLQYHAKNTGTVSITTANRKLLSRQVVQLLEASNLHTKAARMLFRSCLAPFSEMKQSRICAVFPPTFVSMVRLVVVRIVFYGDAECDFSRVQIGLVRNTMIVAQEEEGGDRGHILGGCHWHGAQAQDEGENNTHGWGQWTLKQHLEV